MIASEGWRHWRPVLIFFLLVFNFMYILYIVELFLISGFLMVEKFVTVVCGEGSDAVSVVFMYDMF